MSNKSGGSLGSKVKSLATEIKTHWNTPAEGKYVPYKEYKDIFIAVGSNYAGSKILEYIGFWASCYLIMHHYKLPYLTFSVIGIINMPLGSYMVVCLRQSRLSAEKDRAKAICRLYGNDSFRRVNYSF